MTNLSSYQFVVNNVAHCGFRYIYKQFYDRFPNKSFVFPKITYIACTQIYTIYDIHIISILLQRSCMNYFQVSQSYI